MRNRQEQTEYSVRAEPSTYQTGSTKPPKNHRGLILLLLGLVIFLGGIAMALGFTNIQLFKALSSMQEASSSAVDFSASQERAASTVAGDTRLGFSGETVPEFWHNYHGLPRGIFIQTVNSGSEAERLGILPGDILLQVDGVCVHSLEELAKILPAQGETVEVVICRDDTQICLQLPVQGDDGE